MTLATYRAAAAAAAAAVFSLLVCRSAMMGLHTFAHFVCEMAQLTLGKLFSTENHFFARLRYLQPLIVSRQSGKDNSMKVFISDLKKSFRLTMRNSFGYAHLLRSTS